MSAWQTFGVILSLLGGFIGAAWLNHRRQLFDDASAARERARKETELVNEREQEQIEKVDEALDRQMVELTPLPVDSVDLNDALAFFRGEGLPGLPPTPPTSTEDGGAEK